MSTNSSAPVALPLDKELVMKVIPMPADCNANGDIFGGWVMAQVDLAGSVIPARHAGGRMATVAVNRFALLWHDKNGLGIADTGRRVTTVNGERIPSGKRVALKAEDTLQFGKTVLQVKVIVKSGRRHRSRRPEPSGPVTEPRGWREERSDPKESGRQLSGGASGVPRCFSHSWRTWVSP